MYKNAATSWVVRVVYLPGKVETNILYWKLFES